MWFVTCMPAGAKDAGSVLLWVTMAYTSWQIVEMHEMVSGMVWKKLRLSTVLGCSRLKHHVHQLFGDHMGDPFMDATLGLIKAAPPCYSRPFYSCTAGDCFSCDIYLHKRCHVGNASHHHINSMLWGVVVASVRLMVDHGHLVKTLCPKAIWWGWY